MVRARMRIPTTWWQAPFMNDDIEVVDVCQNVKRQSGQVSSPAGPTLPDAV